MIWTITDSTEPWETNGVSSDRTFQLKVELEENDPQPHDNLARDEVIKHLEKLVQDYGDTKTPIRKLDVAEDPTATERRLRYFLHGLPIQSVTATEVAGSEGLRYRAEVKWGRSAVSSSRAASAASATANNEITDDTAGAAVTVAHELSAGVTGKTIDFAPLRASLFLLYGEELSYTAPYERGAINVRQPEPEGPIQIDGLTYSRPPVNRRVTLEVSGAGLSSTWVKRVADAADRGTLNTEAVTIAGIEYQPLELLLVSLDVRTGSQGTTVADLGFSSEPRQSLVVQTVGDDKVSDLDALLAGDGPRFGDWIVPTDPPTTTVNGDAIFYYSGHDYRTPFVENYLEGTAVRQRVRTYSIHKIWDEQSYAAILGVTEL